MVQATQRPHAFVAVYEKVSRGYMGRVLGFPGVISEGKTLDECRESLNDALHEMLLAYADEGETIPGCGLIFEPLLVEA
jgi:predicted RNase H-like HicB family nuclease